MNDLVRRVVRPLEVGQIKGADRLQRPVEGFVGPSIRTRRQFFLQLPECPQYAGTIEPLSFTMFAITHRLLFQLSSCRPDTCARLLTGSVAGLVRGLDQHDAALD